jgi:hypothetical protein
MPNAQYSTLNTRGWFLVAHAEGSLSTGHRAMSIGHFTVFSLAIALATAAQAMTVAPADFDEMVAASQIIVHGQVIDVRPYETAGRRTIERLVTVRVAEALKGDPGSVASFRVPGGQVGRYRRVMVGAPEFTVGEEVVLFLRGRMPAVPMPFGLTQGVYRVTRNQDGRAMVLPPPASGRLVRGDPSRRPVDVRELAAQVRALAGSKP